MICGWTACIWIWCNDQWVLLYRLKNGVQFRRFTNKFEEFGQLLIFIYEHNIRNDWFVVLALRFDFVQRQLIIIAEIINYLPAFGIDASAANARNAERFSSSCFSYSCLTAFALTLSVHVTRNGSTNWSNSARENEKKNWTFKMVRMKSEKVECHSLNIYFEAQHLDTTTLNVQSSNMWAF